MRNKRRYHLTDGVKGKRPHYMYRYRHDINSPEGKAEYIKILGGVFVIAFVLWLLYLFI